VERDWAKGLGWKEREMWNFFNLALMTSETVGILRSLWVNFCICTKTMLLVQYMSMYIMAWGQEGKSHQSVTLPIVYRDSEQVSWPLSV
jgi:hypothetical protein